MKVQRRSRRILTILEHAGTKFDKMVEIARLSNAVNQTDPKLLEELSAGVLLQLEAAISCFDLGLVAIACSDWNP